MIGKVLLGLAVASFLLGFYEAQSALEGSHRAIEAGILIIISPILAIAGFLAWKMSNKKCPACAERVKKDAKICKHCHSALGDGK